MRRTLTLRAAAAAVAVPTLLTGVVACGSDAASGEGTSAADAAEDLPGEGEEVDPGDFMDDVKEGFEASTTAKMAMSIDFGTGAMEGDGELDYTTDPPNLTMTLDEGAMGIGAMDMRLVDGILYMNLGSLSQDKFVRFDLDDAESLPPGMDQLEGQMDPLAAFEDMEDALTSVTFVGTEELEGDEVNRFEVTVDTTKMETMEELPAEAGVPEELSYDLWLDGDYRMRKADLTMALEAGPVSEVSTVYTLSDWGTEVDIEAPPEDEVMDSSEMRFAG
jgi:hypothetical protein